jgi:DNA-directed RNA polymerase subunit RPC12/RpoP
MEKEIVCSDCGYERIEEVEDNDYLIECPVCGHYNLSYNDDE